MTKQFGYIYSTQNLLEIPQKYQMSPFQGHKFLEQYKESRKASMQLIKDKINTITLDQVTAQMQPNFQHPLEIINSSKFRTQKLFESIFLIFIFSSISFILISNFFEYNIAINLFHFIAISTLLKIYSFIFF